MLKNFTLAIVLASQLFVSSCAYINAQRNDVNGLITKWIAEQEFDKARDTLKQVKTTHPQYLKLMLRNKEIFKKSNKFVAKTIKQTHFFIRENKWEDAYTVYNFALNRVSKNKSLNFSYKTYLLKRQVYINKLKHKLLINTAHSLIKDLPIQQKIALAVKESSTEQNKYDTLRSRATETVSELINCSSKNLKLKRINTSKKCIQLAQMLEPSKESSGKIKLQLRKINKLSIKNNKKRLKAESNSITKAINKYKAAFAKNDLHAANTILNKIIANNKGNYELTKLKSILDESINKKIETGIETGRILYSKGNIKLALDKWSSLLKIDPENIELKSHISRAERVLRKLRTLTSKDNNGD